MRKWLPQVSFYKFGQPDLSCTLAPGGVNMTDLRALDFVRCAQFLESRRGSDEQVKSIRMFVESWPSLVLATESQNYAEYKRAMDRIDALASRAAAERLNLIG